MLPRIFQLYLYLSAASLAAPMALFGQVEQVVQSPAKPYGLNITSPVYQAGSDAASASFQSGLLQDLLSIPTLNANSAAFKNGMAALGAQRIDPNKIYLQTATEARVYMVNESSNKANSIGAVDWSKRRAETYLPNASIGKKLTTSTPVQSGDFVETGKLGGPAARSYYESYYDHYGVDAGKLDFFLVKDGAKNKYGNLVFAGKDYPFRNQSADGAIAYALEGSPFLYLGFSTDVGGSPSFDDVVVAVDIGQSNIQALTSPEPSTIAILAVLCLAVLFIKRRHKMQRA